jgi:hypothetical protein
VLRESSLRATRMNRSASEAACEKATGELNEFADRVLFERGFVRKPPD